MKNNPIVLSIFVVFAVFAVSCQKEATKTKTELLTEKSWLTTAITVNPGISGGAITITDLFAEEQSCVNDNLRKYSVDKKYSEEEGATKCNSPDPQIVKKGTWSFNTGETVLTIIASDTITYNLVELNATTLKVSEQKTLQGAKYTLSHVLTAQ
jgi:hypothetical protein